MDISETSGAPTIAPGRVTDVLGKYAPPASLIAATQAPDIQGYRDRTPLPWQVGKSPHIATVNAVRSFATIWAFGSRRSEATIDRYCLFRLLNVIDHQRWRDER